MSTLTKQQEEVVNSRGGNLLVSAAAGAGKTFVLVKRIIDRIMNEDFNIDELLIVTFTKDAAREMKERIEKELSEQIRNLGEDYNSQTAKKLIKQVTLLQRADISTIDSFCKKIVMENFREAGIDTAVRTIDETEGVIIQKKVIGDLLEDEYEKKTPEFINFVEFFARDKSDTIIEDIILQLYKFSESLPSKMKWFNRLLESSKISFLGSNLENELMKYSKFIFERLLSKAKDFSKIVFSKGGPIQYEDAAISDLELFEELLKKENFTEVREKLSTGFTRLSGKKPKGVEVDEEKKNLAQSIRDSYKTALNDLKESFFDENVEEIENSRKVTNSIIRELIRLVIKFDEMYKAEKKKKNVVDISDWAHLALKVLVDDDGKPTEATLPYREHFKEIMIDEYQDSNFLQENILTSISNNNLFMVGDVKQSIYKFRNAKPELFVEKYNTYSHNIDNKRIDLSKNFRSRDCVVNTVNTVFKSIMTKETGKIEYDKANELIKGRKTKENEDSTTEILLFNKGEENEYDFTDIEYEAYMISLRIKKLQEEGIKYSDIAILLRTNAKWADTFRRILISEEIPAVCESSTGYFSSWEVEVMLSILRIIDNPYQDIPLCTVLLSPIGDFTEEELAEIKINARNENLWDALNLSKTEKSLKFLKWLNNKRDESTYLPISALIRQLLDETSFYDYVVAMPQGETRGANLEMLVVKAKAYEETSLHGVVHFVNYIDKLKKYSVDFGEAGSGEGLNAVKIMSIHKSKGLQFPVVFVSGLGKQMNNQDSRSAVIIHEDVGIGIDNFNIKTREKRKTLLKKFMARKIRLESLAEEIRLLYVALTRAEDRLLLTGSVKDINDKISKWENTKHDYLSIIGVNNFLDLIMPILVTEAKKGNCKIEKNNVKNLIEAITKSVKKDLDFEEYIKSLSNIASDCDEIFDIFNKELNYNYPYSGATSLKTKFSVTEILSKKSEKSSIIRYNREEKDEVDKFVEYVPAFLNDNKKPAVGAVRGTLYHKILRNLSFNQDDLTELKDYLTENELKSINIEDFETFLRSNLYKRMSDAAKRGELHKEAPFVMGLEKEMNSEKEMVLVQGIIDAWFREDDKIVLLDYKTDKVFGKTGEEELIKRYAEQLEIYAEALKRATGRQVSEKYLYSFSLVKEIRVDVSIL